MTDLKVPNLTLKKAKELTKNHKRMLNGYIIVMNGVAPLSSSILLDKKILEREQEAVQKEHNKKGMLVVHSSDGAIPENEYEYDEKKIYEGEQVLYGQNPLVAFATTIRSKELLDDLDLKGAEPQPEHYKKYVLMAIHKNSVIEVIQ